MRNTASVFASECRDEYTRYREKCKSTVRGDGVHDLWVKLAWVNRQQARHWASQAA